MPPAILIRSGDLVRCREMPYEILLARLVVMIRKEDFYPGHFITLEQMAAARRDPQMVLIILDLTLPASSPPPTKTVPTT